MRFAPISIRLNCPQTVFQKTGADRANGLALPRFFGELHQQAVGKLVAAPVVINFRRNHLDRAWLIKFCNKFRRRAGAFEPAKLALFLSSACSQSRASTRLRFFKSQPTNTR